MGGPPSHSSTEVGRRACPNPRGGGGRQGAEASLAVEAAVEGLGVGGLRRAVLYNMRAEGVGRNLKECALDADGKARGQCPGHWGGGMRIPLGMV